MRKITGDTEVVVILPSLSYKCRSHIPESVLEIGIRYKNGALDYYPMRGIRGEAFFELKDYERAEKDFSKLLKDDATNLFVISLFIQVLEKNGKLFQLKQAEIEGYMKRPEKPSIADEWAFENYWTIQIVCAHALVKQSGKTELLTQHLILLTNRCCDHLDDEQYDRAKLCFNEAQRCATYISPGPLYIDYKEGAEYVRYKFSEFYFSKVLQKGKNFLIEGKFRDAIDAIYEALDTSSEQFKIAMDLYFQALVLQGIQKLHSREYTSAKKYISCAEECDVNNKAVPCWTVSVEKSNYSVCLYDLFVVVAGHVDIKLLTPNYFLKIKTYQPNFDFIHIQLSKTQTYERIMEILHPFRHPHALVRSLSFA